MVFLRALCWGRYYEAIVGVLIKFADDTKLSGVANTPEERTTIQSDLDRL